MKDTKMLFSWISSFSNYLFNKECDTRSNDEQRNDMWQMYSYPTVIILKHLAV